MSRLALRIGYWNVYGAYNATDKGGFQKTAAQGALIESLKCDLFVTLENHEETYRTKEGKTEKAYMPLLRATPSYRLDEGDGGNHLLIRKGFKAEVLRSSNVRLAPGSKPVRSASKWNLQANGVRFWVGATHLVAGQDAVRKATRAAQVVAFLAFMNTIQRGLIAYDSNDFRQGQKGAPQTLMDLAGWRDMRVKALTPVVNSNKDSHPDGRDNGTWIENLRTRKGVRVLRGALVQVDPKLSDHNLLWADVEIDSTTMLGKND